MTNEETCNFSGGAFGFSADTATVFRLDGVPAPHLGLLRSMRRNLPHRGAVRCLYVLLRRHQRLPLCPEWGRRNRPFVSGLDLPAVRVHRADAGATEAA